jgi:hypothetical protein
MIVAKRPPSGPNSPPVNKLDSLSYIVRIVSPLAENPLTGNP